MSKRNQLDLAIDNLKSEKAVLDAAITALEQQKRQAPKRKARAAAQGGPGDTSARS